MNVLSGVISAVRLKLADDLRGLNHVEAKQKLAERDTSGAFVISTPKVQSLLRQEQNAHAEINAESEAARADWKADMNRRGQEAYDQGLGTFFYNVDDYDKSSFWKAYAAKWSARAADYGLRLTPNGPPGPGHVAEAINLRLAALVHAFADRLRLEGPTPEIARVLDEMADHEIELAELREEFKAKEQELRDRYEAKTGPLEREHAALLERLLKQELVECALMPSGYIGRPKTSGQILEFMGRGGVKEHPWMR